ncbi:unnamed protein product [Owenia fusiformis]|uniref:SOCS box domain-containing protein n=1 Tax=Owenia fusiformis TaxID=6347 RepID=A0A8S4PC13_OWEFU|nr:unnamed protein product [Owenia fusiformis]
MDRNKLACVQLIERNPVSALLTMANHVDGGLDFDTDSDSSDDEFEEGQLDMLPPIAGWHCSEASEESQEHLEKLKQLTSDDKEKLKQLYRLLCSGSMELKALILNGTLSLNVAFYLKSKSDSNGGCYCGHYFESGHNHYVEKYLDRLDSGCCECLEVEGEAQQGGGDGGDNDFQIAVVYPLHVVARHGHTWLVQLLVEQGCNTSVQTKILRKTPLHLAIEHNQLDSLKVLVEHSTVETCNIQDYHGHSPLILTAKKLYYGFHHQMLDLLLNKGCDTNMRNQRGETALLILVCDNSTYSIQKLIDHGADVNICSKRGIAPLTYAVRNNKLENVVTLIKAGCDVNKPAIAIQGSDFPLHMAVNYGNVECVKLLLDAGADTNVKGESGYTPLHAAAISNFVQICEELLVKGSNVNIQNKHGYTPLHLAAWDGHFEIVKLLLDNGALHDTRTDDKNTQLALAAHGNHSNIIDLLLTQGCDVNNADKDNDTPLMYCTYNGDLESCKKLIEHGANINFRNVQNTTALWNAVQMNHPKVVQLLLENNADLDVASRGIDQHAQSIGVVLIYENPVTPFLAACKNNEPKLAKLLALAGCRISEDDLKELLAIVSAMEQSQSQLRDSMTKLYDFCCNPRTLKRITRRAVRQCLGANIGEKVLTLEIPLCLRDFITLKEV